MSLEAQVRQIIDQKLTAAGWTVQDMKSLNPSASLGVAVREYPTDTKKQLTDLVALVRFALG